MGLETPEILRNAGTTRAGVAFGVLLAGYAAGCAAVPDYGEYLMRWQGKNRARVIADWGEPDYRYRDHRGRDTLQYIHREVIFETLSGGRRVVWWCLTDFHIGADDRVLATSSTGNHCFAPDDLAAARARRRRGGRMLPSVPPPDGLH